MASLNYFPDGEAIREFFEPAVKIPLPPGQAPPRLPARRVLSPSWSALRAGSQLGEKGSCPGGRPYGPAAIPLYQRGILQTILIYGQVLSLVQDNLGKRYMIFRLPDLIFKSKAKGGQATF